MELFVYFEQYLVGILHKNEDDIYSFQYAEEWLDNTKSFDLSLQLLRRREPFGNRQTIAFFENLLPEGDVREVLLHHRTSGVFQTLRRYGKDCAGAIIISPESTPPIVSIEQSELLLSQDEIKKALQKGTMVDILAERNPGYLSIAGAQDKFPAIVRDNQIYLALTGQPTTHIIKPPISRFKESVYNEYFCMRLAKKVGLNVPDVQVLTGSIPLFVIERFDRIESQNMIGRLHQQDFCQALGFSSSYKYEQNGGPSFADCFQCVKQHVHYSKKSSNLFSLLDWFCFNLLIGNNDSHAKNLSLLLSSETYELTPFYDLLCTVIYPTLKRDFAFQIGGRYDVLSLSTNHIQKLETELDVRSGTILHHLQRMWNTLQLEMPILLEEIELELSDCKIARRIMLQIQKRAKGFRTVGLT